MVRLETDDLWIPWEQARMFELLQILTVVIVTLVAVPCVAHAFEHPGKMRLDEATYRAVQRIYYPGFTAIGFAEPLGIGATALLLFLTPAGTTAFWLVLIALLGMIAMHAIFWIVVQPANKHWMEGQAMSAHGAAFFRTGVKQGAERADWMALRDRWEYGHIARAVLTGSSLLALTVSIVLR